jgi:hypothetical protein
MSIQNLLELFHEKREETEKRIADGIEKYRKGDLEILIKDKDGAPIKGARLTLSQKNHEFKFGANLFMLDEMESTEKNEKYKKAFAETFNIATLPSIGIPPSPSAGICATKKTARRCIAVLRSIFASNFASRTESSRASTPWPTFRIFQNG